MLLTIERARELFDYDPKEGTLTRRISVAKSPKGTIIHSKNRRIMIDTVRYRVANLVWFLHHGEWYDGILDHKDCNEQNIKLDNLRPATFGQNMHNKVYRSSSGFKGVTWVNQAKPWFAQIAHNGKKIYLGTYSTKEEAAEAYQAASERLHGEFANLGVK